MGCGARCRRSQKNLETVGEKSREPYLTTMCLAVSVFLSDFSRRKMKYVKHACLPGPSYFFDYSYNWLTLILDFLILDTALATMPSSNVSVLAYIAAFAFVANHCHGALAETVTVALPTTQPTGSTTSEKGECNVNYCNTHRVLCSKRYRADASACFK